MAVVLRMARYGNTHRPFYHLVATDSRSARDGRFIEKLGHYDPQFEPSRWTLNEDRIRYWYERGAQPSNTVATILKKQNLKFERLKTDTKKKK